MKKLIRQVIEFFYECDKYQLNRYEWKERAFR